MTSREFSYTNHTLLPEALETWSVELVERLLPRHMEIILEINRLMLDDVRVRTHGDEATVRNLSIIDETGGRSVRMANLAATAAHRINGVSALHTELLAERVMADHHRLWPDKYLSITNGVTPRRFIRFANAPLSRLLDETVGPGWDRDLDLLAGLEGFVDDTGFREAWTIANRDAKRHLARLVGRYGHQIDPDSLFDVQVKRIHEYKRQHLALLYVVSRYNAIKSGALTDPVPRTFLFGGKAAPGYHMAKLIIRAITAVAAVVNTDPDVNRVLKVVFVPNFNVSSAQAIYPAADLSEQISTAGYEASGTGNMKFALNGALTIGTLDGANVEIRERVGDDHFFLFGLTAEGVLECRRNGYDPGAIVEADPDLAAAVALLESGYFTHGDTTVFTDLTGSIRAGDHFCVAADFRAYADTQARVDDHWRDHEAWTRSSVLNTARTGYFSADRAVREYAERVWNLGAPDPKFTL